jgi:hypothetical protein
MSLGVPGAMVTWLLVVLSVLITTSSAFAQAADERRPALLMPLYISHVTLQGLDVHSTVRALQAGGREANPLLRHVTPAGMIAAKAAASASTLFLTEKLWRRNRKAAVITMLAANAAMSFVVANNYRIGGT